MPVQFMSRMSLPPIRVLFVVPDLRFGGAERHAVTLLLQMDRTKFAGSAICIGEEGELFHELTGAGIQAQALHLGNKWNGARALGKLISYMRRTRPDVVIVRGYNAEMLGRIAALAARVEHSVVWVHDMGNIAPRSWLRNLAGRALMPSTSRHFGVADAQRSHLTGGLHCPAEKIRIIYNGVDLQLFGAGGGKADMGQFGIAADDFVVGIVAALRPEKDHATLLRSAKILLAGVSNAKILIVGDGPERTRLEELGIELGIADRVCFTGGRNDVRDILRGIDVFVLCSVTECFPLSVLEAMASARPVVCTDVGGIGEIVQHGVTGYLVPAQDSQALSDRIKELLSDPALAHRMGQAGLRRVEAEFTLKQSVTAAERAIEELVGRRA